MTKELTLGVLGCGQRSAIAHIAHQPEQGVRITACCDTDINRAEALAEKLDDGNIRCYSSLKRMLSSPPDALFVFTPDYLHYEHALSAMKAGCSIYLEKPMTLSIKHCDKLIRLSEKKNIKLFLGHNMRYLQVIRQMRQLLLDGAIGELKSIWCRHFVGHGGDFYFKDWHADRSASGSLLLQKAVHDFDVMHWFADSYSVQVQAMGGQTLYHQINDRRPVDQPCPKVSVNREHWPPLTQKQLNPVVDVEDISMVNLLMANGVFASYQQCHYTPDYWRNYTLIGTEGRMENYGDFIDAEIHIWNKRTSYQKHGDQVIRVPVNEGAHGGADSVIIKEFIDYLRDRAIPATTPREARNAVAVACTATNSLRSKGKSLKIPV